MSMDSNPPKDHLPTWLEIVRLKVEALRFGSVQIVVHEGRVTMVEALEKTRLPGEIGGEGRPRGERNVIP